MGALKEYIEEYKRGLIVPTTASYEAMLDEVSDRLDALEKQANDEKYSCDTCLHGDKNPCIHDDVCDGRIKWQPKQAAGDDTLLDFQFTVKKYNEALTKVVKERDELQAKLTAAEDRVIAQLAEIMNHKQRIEELTSTVTQQNTK
jgi:hypothetical protein